MWNAGLDESQVRIKIAGRRVMETKTKINKWNLIKLKEFPGGSNGKVSAYNAGDLDLIPGPGRCPGEGNGNPLQYSCLENPMDGGAW